jgi:hypothetical protein
MDRDELTDLLKQITTGDWEVFSMQGEDMGLDGCRFENGAYAIMSEDCEHHIIADFSCTHTCRDDEECHANAELAAMAPSLAREFIRQSDEIDDLKVKVAELLGERTALQGMLEAANTREAETLQRNGTLEEFLRASQREASSAIQQVRRKSGEESQSLRDALTTLQGAALEMLAAMQETGAFDSLWNELFPDEVRRGTTRREEFKRIDAARNNLRMWLKVADVALGVQVTEEN